MDLKLLCYNYFILIFLLTCRHGLSLFEDDYDDTPSFGRCPWIRNKLKNGRVKLRSRGRIAKFLCDPGYELAGKRFATCVRGQWNNPIPVCVARGCPKKPPIRNARITEMHRGAMLVYDCNPGYTLDGSISIYCDGRRWNSNPPSCVESTSDPETSCDFEDPDLCGWSHDPTHDFDWKRNQFSTPSGHVGTGPSYDHTFGVGKGGFYLYLEASSPRKENDVSRLFSPVYPPDLSGGCFIFWYHMYGATTGGLRVYLKPESHVFGELSPAWQKFGDQGNQWLRGHIPISSLHENFQLIIEGVRGTSYVGDSAIDDVQLTKSDCESIENATDTVADTVAESCRGRCRESDEDSACGCNENCVKTDTCCSDYMTICTSGNDTSAENTDEYLPVEEPATTKNPVTVNIIEGNSTYENTEEKETIGTSSSITTEITKSAITSISSTNSSAFSSSTISSTSTTFSTTSTTLPTITPITLPTTSTTLPTTSTMLPTTSTALRTTSTTLPTTSTTLPTTSTTAILLINSTTTSVKPTTSTMPITSGTTRSSSTTILIPPTSSTTSTEKHSSEKDTILSTHSTITTTGQSQTSSTKILSTLISVSPSVSSSSISNSENTTYEYNSSTSTPLVPVSADVKNVDASSSVSTTSVTSTLSTRKTYNLRPRTQKTTPSTQQYYSSTSSYTPVTTKSSTTKQTTLTSSSSSTTTTRTMRSNIIFPSSTISISTYSPVTTTRQSSTTSVKTLSAVATKRQYWYRTTTLETVRDSGYTETLYQKNTTPRALNDHASNAAPKAEHSTSNGSVPTITIASISIVSILIVAGGLAYYMKKQKTKRQSKLSDDSEMRFLSENEEMEYSDASVLDRILVK